MSKGARRVDYPTLVSELAFGRIVALALENWNELSGEFRITEEIPTGMAGSILLMRRPKSPTAKQAGWAIVEEPEPKVRVVRPLDTEQEARALIADRLAAYERMWDG